MAIENALFTNFAVTWLTTGVSSVDTSIALPADTGAQFPQPDGVATFFMAVLEDARLGTREVIKVTNRVDDTLTVVRAQEGTTALDFAEGSSIGNRLTAGMLGDISTILGGLADNYVEQGGDTIVGAYNAYPAPFQNLIWKFDATANLNGFGGGQNEISFIRDFGCTTNLNFVIHSVDVVEGLGLRWLISEYGDDPVGAGDSFTIQRAKPAGGMENVISFDRATGEGSFTKVVHGITPTLATHLVTKAYADSIAGGGDYVLKTGDTMTGPLTFKIDGEIETVRATMRPVGFGPGPEFAFEANSGYTFLVYNYTSRNLFTNVDNLGLYADEGIELVTASGEISIQSPTSITVDPTLPAHVAHKAYVDAAPSVIVALGTTTGWLFEIALVDAISFATGATRKGGTCTTAATTAVTYEIWYKIPAGALTQIGTAVFAIGSVDPTVSFTGAVSLPANSRLRFIRATSADTALVNPSITLGATRG
jgi:hypothetical protein